MGEPVTEKLAPVPDWAVKITQNAIREYRYTGDYLPDPDEQVQIGLRRGDVRIGTVRVRHIMIKQWHLIRFIFESMDGATTETLAARSLKQAQETAPLLMERVCKYGSLLKRGWCDVCSQADRHSQGQYRGLARGPEAPPEPRPPGMPPR